MGYRTTLIAAGLILLLAVGTVVFMQARSAGAGDISISVPSTPTPTPSHADEEVNPAGARGIFTTVPTPTPSNPEEAANYQRNLPPNPPLTGETTDLAPELPEADKATVIVEWADGSLHFYLVAPGVTLDQIPMPSGSRLYDVRPPSRMMGKYPP